MSLFVIGVVKSLAGKTKRQRGFEDEVEMAREAGVSSQVRVYV